MGQLSERDLKTDLDQGSGRPAGHEGERKTRTDGDDLSLSLKWESST